MISSTTVCFCKAESVKDTYNFPKLPCSIIMLKVNKNVLIPNGSLRLPQYYVMRIGNV